MKSWMFLAVLVFASVFAGCGGDKGTDSNGNHPPGVPSNPSPTNNASDQNLDITLSWQCSDPDGDNLVFDLYFGTNSTPNQVGTDITQTSHNPGQLQSGMTYFWKVIAKDNNGHSTSGSVWHFKTIGNQSPAVPSNPNISTYSFGEAGVKVQLKWGCSDPEYDPLSYDIYFGANSNPPLIASNYTSDVYYVNTTGEPLPFNTTYYWKIVAKDDHQNETASQIWQFKTISEVELVGELGAYGGVFNDVVVSGSFAYVTDYLDRLWVIDVSNPASPNTETLISSVNFPHDLEVFGNLLFVAATGYLHIFDVSDPSNTTQLSSIASSGQGPSSGLSVAGNYVYMSSRSSTLNMDCVDVFDISVPSVPVNVATLWGPGCSDVLTWSNYLAVKHRDAGTHVYNISDPTSPVLLTDSWSMHSWYSGKEPFIDGQTLYTFAGSFKIIDVANPMNPLLVGSYTASTFDFDLRCVFADATNAYIASGQYTFGGLVVIDITDPSAPKRIGMYNNPDGALGVFASGGYIYLAAGQSGLLILRLVQ